jgi:predicted HTH transcriptional regulator
MSIKAPNESKRNSLSASVVRSKAAFSEDVSSFANARGGVLVKGVTDNREIVGIGSGHELENKLKFAGDVLSEQLDYPRDP